MCIIYGISRLALTVKKLQYYTVGTKKCEPCTDGRTLQKQYARPTFSKLGGIIKLIIDWEMSTTKRSRICSAMVYFHPSLSSFQCRNGFGPIK